MSVPGFYNAPVTKALLLSSVALTLLCSSSPGAARALLAQSRAQLAPGAQPWRALTSLLPCESLPEGLATWTLLYWFRAFERQLGSSKFAAFVALSSALGYKFEARY